MNDQDYEQLSQYLDGELDIFASRRLEQRLAQEPELQSLLEQLQTQNSAIKAAFIGTEQAPEHIAARLQSNVLAFPGQRGQRPSWQYAVAASLVAAAGLLLVPGLQEAPGGDPMLSSVLHDSPSMASGWHSLDDGRQVRPVLSFKGGDGQWCREYLITTGDSGSRGVACHQEGTWNTMILAATEIPGSASEFRPAGAGDSDEVAKYMADSAAGIALSASEEAELISSDWK